MTVKPNSKKPAALYEKYGIIVILILEVIFFSIKSPTFLKLDNILLVSRQVSFYGIAAVGMTMVLLVGEIDISVGSILAFSGCLSAVLITKAAVPVALACLIAIVISTFFGLLSGTLTTICKVPSLIATLAMQIIIKGCTYLMTGGTAVSGLPDNFKFMGQGFLLSRIPVPVVVWLVIFLLGLFVLNKTYIGRRIYAVGGNKEAARLSGIKTTGIVIGTFVCSAFVAGISGTLMAARLGSGMASVGSDFAMDVLTASVLGGVSLQGGKGNAVNVLVGSFIIGILSNGLVMLGVIEYWQWIIKGCVFLLAVILSNIVQIAEQK